MTKAINLAKEEIRLGRKKFELLHTKLSLQTREKDF